MEKSPIFRFVVVWLVSGVIGMGGLVGWLGLCQHGRRIEALLRVGESFGRIDPLFVEKLSNFSQLVNEYTGGIYRACYHLDLEFNRQAFD